MTTKKHEEDKRPKLTPLMVLGFAFSVGLGFYLLALFFGMGVEAIGIAKRRYPEVVLGIVLLVFIGAGIVSHFNDRSDGDDKH